MPICFNPIGYLRTDCTDIPRHCSVSEVEGYLEIMPEYSEGLAGIRAGQRVVVLFHFDRSPPFTPELLRQKPPHRQRATGVFSICSPRRPNPIGLSVLRVLEVKCCRIKVAGVDMLDRTPILDIKPYVR
jgi:tRNA-Thr(GGU) m(6)t(6)A37 methyltransferase TsaA